MKCIKYCVLFFFINCGIFKISCMNLIDNALNILNNVLDGFKLDGDDDVTKLLDLKNKIDDCIGVFEGLLGDKEAKNILNIEEIKKIFNNIDENDLNNDKSPTGIKKVLASSILFSGDKKTKNVEVNIDKEGKNIEKEDKLIFLFHGMGDNSGKFYSAIQDTIKGFSVVSVEYNGSSLSKLEDFINVLYGNYKDDIKNFTNIYILGYSFGCLIANKFRSKLLEKLKTEFPDRDRKVHFIFYKGFYDILGCPVYSQVVDMLKGFNELYETVCTPNKGFAFLKDRASDDGLADVTSNYKLLSESQQDTKFDIYPIVDTGHDADNNEITGALNKIEENIKNNPNINHVLFVSSENDKMVSEGGRMLFNALTRPQGSAGNGGGSDKSPDCCY